MTIQELAAQILTPGQHAVWELHTQGHSQREISYRLDLARTTITDRLDAANRKLRAHGVTFDHNGHPHLKEPAA